GRHLVATNPYSAQVWDTVSGSQLAVSIGIVSDLRLAALSADGTTLATTALGGRLMLWETESGRPVWRGPLLRGPDGATYTHRGWRGGSAAQRDTHWRRAVERGALIANLSPDKRRLCVATYDNRIEMWDLEADRSVASVGVPMPERSALRDVLALPGGCLVTGEGPAMLLAPDGQIRFFEGVLVIAREGDGALMVTKEAVLRLDGA